MTAAHDFVATVERAHAVAALGGVLLAVALTWQQPLGSVGHWSAVLAGVLLGGGNFHVLAWLTTRMLLSEAPASRNLAVVALVAKLGALALVMLAVFRLLQPDGPTLLAALSLAPVCLIVLAARRGGRLGVTAAPSDAASGGQS